MIRIRFEGFVSAGRAGTPSSRRLKVYEWYPGCKVTLWRGKDILYKS